MTGYEVDFLGCKISHTDAQSIGDALAAAGHDEDTEHANVRVVNTCCITGEAEKKSRKRVRRMLDGVGDDGLVFVTGCGASNDPAQYASIDERVTVLPGAASLAASAIVEAADSLAGLGCRGPAPGVAPGARSASKRTRAFVKVQDGCDFNCSYCIVPAVRGEPRSRDLDAIIDEVRRRAARGQREIVLTGVNIGLYRDANSRIGLDRLLLAVADVDEVDRVRISSIESNHVNRRLVAAMAEHPKVCPHLHVPLQSGDDSVLAAMARHYDARRYARAIDAARNALPELNVTTDVIVGYPTEDDASFERTFEFARSMGFTKVHAFPFSERPGTVAVQHRDPVDRAVKAERSRRLREQADELALAHRARLVGSVDEVIVEPRAASGYGAGAGVLMTDAHVAADAGPNEPRGATTRTGYVRDYSPVVLPGVSDDRFDGRLVVVSIDALDHASGALSASLLDSSSQVSRRSRSAKHAPDAALSS